MINWLLSLPAAATPMEEVFGWVNLTKNELVVLGYTDDDTTWRSDGGLNSPEYPFRNTLYLVLGIGVTNAISSAS